MYVPKIQMFFELPKLMLLKTTECGHEDTSTSSSFAASKQLFAATRICYTPSLKFYYKS